jgi:hypothetical protein
MFCRNQATSKCGIRRGLPLVGNLREPFRRRLPIHTNQIRIASFFFPPLYWCTGEFREQLFSESAAQVVH